jgi:diguanylate cyclase (GGDEF)-like protein
MASELEILTQLTLRLQERLSLDELLREIADSASTLLGTKRVSVRLLDPTRTKLLATCRAGAPLHLNPGSEFRLGEGLIGWIAEQGKCIRSPDAEKDPRFAPRADIREPIGSFLGVPLVSGRACLGVLSSLSTDRDLFTPRHEELLTLLAGICAPHVEVARLSRLSQVDPLTGALNRRGLDMQLPPEADEPVSVIMVDLDYFKRVNDSYGHAIGDEVLKRVTHLLSGVLRAGDAVVRWGGEEFLLILPRVSVAVAGRVAERARAAVEEADVSQAGVKLRVTLSAGVAERAPGEPRDEMVKRADEALYRAKALGRNRVELADRRA